MPASTSGGGQPKRPETRARNAWTIACPAPYDRNGRFPVEQANARQHEAKLPGPCHSWPDGGVTRCAAAGATYRATPELSPFCRSAHFARHAELLERRLESSLRRDRCRRTSAISSPSRNRRALSGNFSDRLRLVLLPLDSERPHVVLGSAADDTVLHGDPCRRDRGAHERALAPCYCGRCSPSASSVCCCGAGPATCGSTSGYNSFPASRCRSFSCCSRRSTPAHPIGSSPRRFMRLRRCLSSWTPRSIRSGRS